MSLVTKTSRSLTPCTHTMCECGVYARVSHVCVLVIELVFLCVLELEFVRVLVCVLVRVFVFVLVFVLVFVFVFVCVCVFVCRCVEGQLECASNSHSPGRSAVHGDRLT